VGRLEPETTRLGTHRIHPFLGVPAGPLCPRPCSGEVDAVFWLPLRVVAGIPEPILHPARGFHVEGFRVGGGVLWGATLRILRRLYGLLQELSIV